MGMFDNYNNLNNTLWPDNLVCFLDVQEEEWDMIVLGSTNIHYFKLPVTADNIKDYLVSYKQGLSIVLEKPLNECELEVIGTNVYLKCTVTPEESRLFNFYNKDTFVQLALMLQDDRVTYSELYRLKVIGSINNRAFEEGSE